MPSSTAKKIAFLGGGMREVELAKALIAAGFTVSVSGLSPVGQLRVPTCLPEEAVRDAIALILPVSGVHSDGRIKEISDENAIIITKELLVQLVPGAIVIVGKGNPYLGELCDELGFKLLELTEDDEFAILNSIPTAEGALVVAIESSIITLHGSNAFILGFGRCGRAIARMLQGIGARVHVVERNPAKRAMAVEMGLTAIPFTNLKETLVPADFIFNTVPSLVLTTEVMETLHSHVVIVDIASGPGGVDFAAAKALGIQAILAQGLPGKYAPLTAGQILAKIVPDKITEALNIGSGR